MNVREWGVVDHAHTYVELSKTQNTKQNTIPN